MAKSVRDTHKVTSEVNVIPAAASPVPAAGTGFDMRDHQYAALTYVGTGITSVDITASGAANMSSPVTVKTATVANQTAGSGISATNGIVEIGDDELRSIDFGSGVGLDAASRPLRYILFTINGTSVTAAALSATKKRPDKEATLSNVYDAS